MELNTNSPEFRAVIETVRETTIQECKNDFSALKKWIPIKEACAMLSISRGMLNTLIDGKKIKSKNIGRVVRISVISIDKYLAE